MTTYKKLCENVADAWAVYDQTGDDTQFAEALEAWALKNAYDAVGKGLCFKTDMEDVRQAYIQAFLEDWKPEQLGYVGLVLRYAASRVNRGYDLPSSPVTLPEYKTGSSRRNGKAVNPERLSLSLSVEFDPSTMDHAVEHDGFAEVELRDEVNAVKAAIKDTELEDLWDKCIELGGDPVAIRREFGQYQGNLILEKLRKYLVSKTNIVEPNTVRDCYG